MFFFKTQFFPRQISPICQSFYRVTNTLKHEYLEFKKCDYVPSLWVDKKPTMNDGLTKFVHLQSKPQKYLFKK